MIWVDAAYADHMLHCMSSWVSSRQCPSRSKLKRSLPHSDWQTLEVSKSYLWKNRLHQNLMVNLMVKNIILYFKYPWITFPSIYFPIAIHWGLASPWILDKFTSSVGFPHCESTQNGESIGNNIYIHTHIIWSVYGRSGKIFSCSPWHHRAVSRSTRGQTLRRAGARFLELGESRPIYLLFLPSRTYRIR